MSLATRITALADRIAAEFNSLRGEIPLRPQIQTRNTDTTLNLNQAAGIVVPITGITDHADAGFTVVGNMIRCDFDGRVNLSASVTMTAAAADISVRFGIGTNGIPLSHYCISGYISNSSGCNESSASIEAAVDVANGDQLFIYTKSEGAAGSLTMLSGASIINVERIK